MKKIVVLLGVFAGLFSIVLWFIFVFHNPYVPTTQLPSQLEKIENIESAVTTFTMLVLPACLAILAAFTQKKYLMLIAFVWSLPISLYCFATPSIFAWFMAPCITYFVCFLLMIFQKKLKVAYR